MLKNKLVVVTQASADARHGLVALLTSRGKQVYELPTIRIIKKRLTVAARAAMRNFNAYDYLIFTSAHTVAFFTPRGLRRSSAPSRIGIRPQLTARLAGSAHRARIIAIGSATAAAAAQRGFHATVMPDRSTSADIAKCLPALRGKNILLPRAATAPRDFIERLKKKGARVTMVSLYATVSVTDADTKFEKALADGRIGCFTFTSPSTVFGLSKRIKKPMMVKKVRGVPAVCIGPRTARSARAFGFKKVITARTFTAEGIVKELRHALP